VELRRIAAVKHAKDLEDVAVAIFARELVPSTVEEEHYVAVSPGTPRLSFAIPKVFLGFMGPYTGSENSLREKSFALLIVPSGFDGP
jgi:hypothetical protein